MVDTLLVFYYEKMVGYIPSSFANLVFTGKRIEVGLKKRQIWSSFFDKCKNNWGKWRGWEWGRSPCCDCHSYMTKFPTNPTMSLLSQYQPFSLPTTQSATRPACCTSNASTTLKTNRNTNQGGSFPGKKPIEFTPIPVSYDNLLSYLLDNSMVAITPAKVPQPPFFLGYDSNATCPYHGGVPGYSIEHCRILKHKVQGLIDAGWLKFEENRSWIMTLASNTIHGEIWRMLLDVSNDPLEFSSLFHYCKQQSQCW